MLSHHLRPVSLFDLKRRCLSSRNLIRLETCSVPSASSALISNPSSFFSFATSNDATPVVFHDSTVNSRKSCRSKRAVQLLEALQAGEDRLIELELGRYNDAHFERVPMRLGQYVEWLKRNAGSGGTVGGNQAYLAQWRGSDEIPGLKQVVTPPSLLKPLLEHGTADLYQTSFFIGPTGAVTPLHYDPYMNLYHLHASSAPKRYAKHFTLLPPHLSQILRSDSLGRTTLRNTSPMPLCLTPASAGSPSDYDHPFAVCVGAAEDQVRMEMMAGKVLQCVLREGDTLFVPRGWLHRVENVVLPGEGSEENGEEEASAGWTAGIGWWFLLRSQPPPTP